MDARRDGVVVPQRFRSAPQLILEIGLNMNPPITDLDIEGDGVRCTLSFAKQPFHCTLLWSSIWALIGKRDGRGYQWVEDMPAELVAVPQAPPPPRMPVVLRAVAPEPAATPTPEPPPEAPPPEESHAEIERKLVAIQGEPTASAEAKPRDPAPTETPAAAEPPAQPPPAQAPPAQAPPAQAPPAPAKVSEEIVEEPPAEGKKKRQLPSYLRVIK